ncbi:MAG: leucine-rich repeat protein [Alistipes sp.]|nr:leucine-rich repeat protein [Alistipes sp.]
MKRLFLLLALCGMVAVGCTEGGVDDNIDNGGNNTEQPGEDDDDENDEKPDDGSEIPDDAYISLNKEVLTFVPDGESVEVKVYSNYEWTLTNNCDWVTASISGGEASEEGTAITLTADLTYDDREGTITFSCGKAKKLLVVSQSFKEAIIADENNVFNVPAEGGNVIINYQTSVECEVIIPEEAKSWISLAPATRALVSESINLDVAENTTYSERSAVVKVVKVGDNTLFAEYTINQVQNDAIIADENNTFNLKGWDQSINIAYQTNVECEVVIPEEAKSWISLAPATRALVNESATLNIAANNMDPERSAVVKVVAANNSELVAEYTITQNQRYFIEYTSEGGYPVSPYDSSAFGATIIRNEYIDGKGYIDFDAPITSIGDDAFYDCTSLTSITIPDSVTSIGYEAFWGCTSLTCVTIGNGVTSIGDRVFSMCFSLTSVYITDIAAWCNISFVGSNSNPLCNAENLYLNNELVTDLIIPDSITSIGDWAFYNCDSLTSVTIPDSVTSIGSCAFENCTLLTSVTIPDSVTSIGSYAFNGCKSLTSVTIGNGVTSIGERAFDYCNSLTSVTIGNGVTSIGKSAFWSCASLTEVYCKPTTPPAIDFYSYYDYGIYSVGSFPFNSGMKIYVPRSSYEAYMQYSSYSDGMIAQDNWYKYESYIEPYDFE